MSALRAVAPALAAALGLGCTTLPTGPSVMALPGSRTSFEQFQVDDAGCRDWAAQRVGIGPDAAAAGAGVGTAAVVTAVGAIAGTAIGAAAGHPGAGAAIGAGSGLLVGSAAGASRAHYAGGEAQSRYNEAYVQCMYAKGNRVPVPRGTVPPDDARRRSLRRAPPPPPAGRPPPPPPDLG